MKTSTFLRVTFIALLSIFAIFETSANNVRITGTSVSGSNITFSISWDNSWNASVAPANWDAVWVFVKYQDCNTRLWAHATLSSLASDHSAASPLQADAVSDGKGVFLRRSAIGGGNINNATITLKMAIPAGTFNYKVFGIEMVNVPQGAFDLGDGASSNSFNPINVTATSQSGGLSSSSLGSGSVAAPPTFPMGYNSFYCMKYEVSQLQYVEFLNSLTFNQQQQRTVSDPIGIAGTYAMAGSFIYRGGIRISTPGSNSAIPAVYACDASAGNENSGDDGQGLAATYLSWADLSSYLDWAALRPMTELEYEKVCRGTAPRVVNEFVWGTTEINAVNSNSGGLINDYEENETFTPAANGLCNIACGTTSTNFGSMRVGVFATPTSGRASSGAAYYGAMEMAGNVWERVVSLSNAAGASFTGVLGNGELAADGSANQATWPSPTTAAGVGLRGGGWIDTVSAARTSARNISVDNTRYPSYGGRGVR